MANLNQLIVKPSHNIPKIFGGGGGGARAPCAPPVPTTMNMYCTLKKLVSKKI